MNADSVNVDLASYNLPPKLEEFRKITKTQNIDENIEFYRFIKSLVSKKSAGIVTLKTWIDSFKTNKIEDIINL